jgi:hypothetical protein
MAEKQIRNSMTNRSFLRFFKLTNGLIFTSSFLNYRNVIIVLITICVITTEKVVPGK